MRKGKIIVIEGTDASGKETQATLLVDRLKGEHIKSEMISFPRYNTPTGKIVGACYLGKPLIEGMLGKSWFEKPTELDPITASLYYAADRREAAPEIKKIINSGKNLIVNRYVESNMGHQGGKIRDRYERERLFTLLDRLEHNTLEIPRADKVIFLYMPWEAAKELKKGRGGHQDAHESDDEHLKNAEEAYLHLSERNNWMKINCTKGDGITPRTIGDISSEVYDKIITLLL